MQQWYLVIFIQLSTHRNVLRPERRKELDSVSRGGEGQCQNTFLETEKSVRVKQS